MISLAETLQVEYPPKSADRYTAIPWQSLAKSIKASEMHPISAITYNITSNHNYSYYQSNYSSKKSIFGQNFVFFTILFYFYFILLLYFSFKVKICTNIGFSG